MEDLSFDRLCMELAREREMRDLRAAPEGSVQAVWMFGG